MLDLEFVHLELPEAGVAVLTMQRADGPNVVSAALCEQLLRHCESLAADDTLHAVVLRAEGPTFCVGADVVALASCRGDLSAHVVALIDAAHAAVLAMKRLPVPVIASVQGVAAGGGLSLALACDRVLAARSAKFAVAYLQLGATPDMGLSHSLQALLGARKALEFFLSPGTLTADAAHSLGLVTEVVDSDALDTAALAVARQWVALPRMAVIGAKALFAADATARMERQMKLEKGWFVRCASTPEFAQRVAAFGSRRPSHGSGATAR